MSSEYVGRRWTCSCGWKGAESDALDHAMNDCREDHPQVGPRYYPDPHREGKQAGLDRWSA